MKQRIWKILFRNFYSLQKGNFKNKYEFSNNRNEGIYYEYIMIQVSTKTHKIYLERDDVYEIKADVTFLLRAIRALLENAMKYSEKGTNVYIKSAIIDGKNGEVSVGMKE